MHLVASSSETLPSIAKWYTGSEKSSLQLITKNIGTSKALQPGARILIPMNVLKTARPMPKRAAPKKKSKANQGKTTAQTTYDEIMDDLNPTASHSVSLPPPLTNEIKNEEREVVESISTETHLIPGENTPKESNSGNSFDPSGRSLEEIVAEEEAELKKLRGEME